MQLKNFENCYISCGCNRSPHCLAWGPNNLVYYGSCNAIAICDPNKFQVYYTVTGHSKEVRSVRFVHGAANLLISTAGDNTAIVWETVGHSLEAKCTLKGHTSAVTVACGLKRSSDILVATTSTDLSVNIWSIPTDTYEPTCIQTIKFGSGFCLDVRLQLLPNSDTVILACAQDNFKISLHTFENNQFVKKESLSGHEDWVTCLDWIQSADGDLLLSSGSQDTYIRLWRISLSESAPKLLHELGPGEEIQVEEKVFSAGKLSYSIKLESVLLCHNSWIQSVMWNKDCDDNLSLLSSSTDGTICLWHKIKNVDLWTPTRLGILKEDSLGILGCVSNPETDVILAHSLHGAFHRWLKRENTWQGTFTVGGGHFDAVVDLCWEPNGEYLFTCSTDQTTRIHASWKTSDVKPVWFELGRPQVHGYDMTCIAAISRSCFASGGDEKVARVFKTSKQFLSHLKSLCGIELSVTGTLSNVATQQELGLSNLSVTDTPDSAQALILQTTENVKTPIPEEVLWKSTLWPEERKLYGHGFELHCMAASHSGRYLASACRARMKEHASIIIWDTTNWTEIQQLICHELTVTQIEFSPNDEYLLAVSRDRRLSVYKKNENESAPYELVFATNKKSTEHTRIIWACSWSTDGKYFVTGSREGRVVVWSVADEIKPVGSLLTLKQAATALDFILLNSGYVIAVGCEDGSINIYQWQSDRENWTELKSLKPREQTIPGNTFNSVCHHKTVRRLAFRTSNGVQEGAGLLLASCSDDHSVKIFKMDFDK